MGQKSIPKCERIGRAREKYKRIAHYYTVTVHEHEGIETKVEWEYTKKSQSDMNYSGSPILRTDRTELDNTQIWDVYMMLLEVEDAFKMMKSELGIRPNFIHIRNLDFEEVKLAPFCSILVSGKLY